MSNIKLFEDFYSEEELMRNKELLKIKTKEFINEMSPKSILNEEFVILYHGTTKKNFNAIMKSGMFKANTFFAFDFETAKKYSMMVGGKTGVVTNAVVYIGSVLPVAFFLSLNEEVYFKNGVYVPKYYKFK